MFNFFIDRPVFSAVISLIISLAGVVAVVGLPITQYPQIVPPQVLVSTAFPGANANVVAQSIAAPIEQVGHDMAVGHDEVGSDQETRALGLALRNLDAADLALQRRKAHEERHQVDEVGALAHYALEHGGLACILLGVLGIGALREAGQAERGRQQRQLPVFRQRLEGGAHQFERPAFGLGPLDDLGDLELPCAGRREIGDVAVEAETQQHGEAWSVEGPPKRQPDRLNLRIAQAHHSP